MPEKLDDDEKIIEIETERLRDFKDHPFRIKADQQMQQLMESIERYGILSPLIVRPIPEGVYEIISGHRRKYAATMLGFRKVPVVIRTMKDPEAVIAMVDANLQREQIKPSERAFAYKMKYEAMRSASRSGSRGQVGHAGQGTRTVQLMGNEVGESAKQIQRYLKLTSLIPGLLSLLDDGMIGFNPAVEIAFLPEVEQSMLLEVIQDMQATPSLSQAQRLKRMSQEGKLTVTKIRQVLGEIKKSETNRVTFKNEQLYRFFPRSYSPERMKQEIVEILRQWTKRQAARPASQTTPVAPAASTKPSTEGR